VSAEPCPLEWAALSGAASLEWAVLTEPQAAWVRAGSPMDRDADGRPLLWRGGNQIGKSFAQACKILHFVRRSGPYANRRPGPVKILVVSISKEQMIPLMDKLWMLLDKSEAPKARYEEEFGFRGKPPRIVFGAGPGKGSTITFATYSQGSTRIAGATVDVVVLDEPPPESMWSEVVARVFRKGGQIWCSFTLTLDSPPVEYLKAEAEKGLVREIKTRLNLDAFRRPNGMPPMMTRRKIEAFIGSLLEVERPLRVDAEWETVSRGRWLTLWGPHCVSDDIPPLGALLVVGTDHGARAGRQASALLAVSQVADALPSVWVLEEYVSDGFTTPEMDAAALHAMLGRRGLTWRDVDLWVGDRASGIVHDVRKSNAILRRALAEQVNCPRDAFPRIEIPYKYRGSATTGLRLLNALMGPRPDGAALKCSTNCTQFPAAVKRYDGDRASPDKDIIDAVRYAVEATVRGGSWLAGGGGVYKVAA